MGNNNSPYLPSGLFHVRHKMDYTDICAMEENTILNKRIKNISQMKNKWENYETAVKKLPSLGPVYARHESR